MLLDFFLWDMKKVRNICQNRHAVAGRRLLVCLFSGFSECMRLILKTLHRFGRRISFVWWGLVDSNLLQQVSVAVVQISDRKVSWSVFHLHISSLLLLNCKKIFLVTAVTVSVDLTSSVIVICGSFCTAM